MSAALACPSCERRLRPVDYDGTQVDVCDCGGMWFDRGELEQWARSKQLNGPLPDGSNGALLSDDSGRCPRCCVSSLRDRGRGGIAFAHCTRCHGIWLFPQGAARLDPAATPGPSGWEHACGLFFEALLQGLWLAP